MLGWELTAAQLLGTRLGFELLVTAAGGAIDCPASWRGLAPAGCFSSGYARMLGWACRGTGPKASYNRCSHPTTEYFRDMVRDGYGASQSGGSLSWCRIYAIYGQVMPPVQLQPA